MADLEERIRAQVRQFIPEAERSDFETSVSEVDDLEATLKKIEAALSDGAPEKAREIAYQICRAKIRLWGIELTLLKTVDAAHKEALREHSAKLAELYIPKRDLIKKFEERQIPRKEFFAQSKKLSEPIAEIKQKEINPLLGEIGRLKLSIRILEGIAEARYPDTRPESGMLRPLAAISHAVRPSLVGGVDQVDNVCRQYSDRVARRLEELADPDSERSIVEKRDKEDREAMALAKRKEGALRTKRRKAKA